MNWVVCTETGMYGPYDSYEFAYFFATINFGYDGWTIEKADLDN